MTTHTLTLHLIKNTHRGLKTAATPSHITEIHSGVFWREEPGGSGLKLKEQFVDICLIFCTGEEIKTEFTFLNCSFDSCEFSVIFRKNKNHNKNPKSV